MYVSIQRDNKQIYRTAVFKEERKDPKPHTHTGVFTD